MRRQRWPQLLCLLVAGAAAGCTALMPTRRHALMMHGVRPQSILDDGYHDFVGVMHIHTRYSHDAHGTMPDVIRAANDQELDFAVVTEHNTLQPLRDGWQGRHGGTLLMVGTELSTRGGHYLALNVTEEIDYHHLSTQQVIDEVNRQGGLGFIAHPFFKKRRWTDMDVTGFTGLEAYNLAHDTLDENRLRLVLWTLTVPPDWFYLSLIDRPYDPLKLWETFIARDGRVVGIGSADAHEFHAVGLKFASYPIMFRLIRTHVLVAPALAADAGPGRLGAELAPSAFYDALRQGHAYLAIELLAEARGFTFFAERQGRVAGIMGDAVSWRPDLLLTAGLPFPAEMTLLRDGQAVARTTGTTWQVPAISPGVYRLEASRHNTPWIFSNPIYVRPDREYAP